MSITQRIHNWFAERNFGIVVTVWDIIVASFTVIFNLLDRLTSVMVRGMVVGIILNIVAYFFPELPERIPITFGIFDGFIQFNEFAVKSALGYINAFFHGNGYEFLGEIWEQFQVLWTQFVTWMSNIQF